MREKLKYFIINKAYDYNRGFYENMTVRGNGLCFSSDSGSGVGKFLTRVFDSGQRGLNWHRLVINTENCEPEALRITVYSCDSGSVRYRGNAIPVEEFMELEGISLEDRLSALAPYVVRKVSGVTDVLLHYVSGRFFWAYIEVYSPGGGKAARIDSVKIYLPSASWIDHLPAIYRAGDGETHFLERYLGIFQTVYEELDAEIADMANRFDPECAEAEFLEWIAGWLNIRDTKIWTEEQMRKLLMKAVRLYRRRGTKESLSEMIELYTGEKPFIVEGSDVGELADRAEFKELLSSLYGADPSTVTVMIQPGHDTEVIKRIAMEMLPVTAELNLIELDPYISLGKHAYLGVNSGIGAYKPAVLDGRSRLTLTALGGTQSEDDPDEDRDPEDG